MPLPETMSVTLASQINPSRNPYIPLLWRLKSPASRLFTQPIIQPHIKETPKLRITGLCKGNSPVTGEFLHKWPVTRKILTSSYWPGSVSPYGITKMQCAKQPWHFFKHKSGISVYKHVDLSAFRKRPFSAFRYDDYQPSVAYWCRMRSEILVNTGSGNGLLPDGIKPLPKPMLSYHQRDPLTFIPW